MYVHYTCGTYTYNKYKVLVDNFVRMVEFMILCRETPICSIVYIVIEHFTKKRCLRLQNTK